MQAKTAFLLVVAVLFFYVLSPLVLPVLMGAILAVIFYPLAQRLDSKGLDSRLTSAILTAAITIVLLVPASVLIYLGAKSGLQQIETLRAATAVPATGAPSSTAIENWLASPFVSRMIDMAATIVPFDRSGLVDVTQDLLRSFGAKAADWLGVLFAKLPGAALDLLMIVVSVYFMLVDGPSLLGFLRRHSIFEERATDRLVEAMASICRSVVLASVASGASQAVLMIMACLGVGQHSPFLVGVLVFFASFLPVVGSSPVTFGLAIYWLSAVSTGGGVALIIVALAVAGVDNVVRAAVLRGSANLHPLLAFASAFGGLQAFGFIGIFLGPILASLFLTVLEIAGPAAVRAA